MSNKVIDLIVNLLSGLKNGDKLADDSVINKPIQIFNCKYLLGQVIRQLTLREDRLFVTEKAFEIWNNITDESIFKFSYRDSVIKNNDYFVEVSKYSGSSRTALKTEVLKKGDKIIFNDVFIDEHIIPVADIIKALLALDEPYDYNEIYNILDNVCICKMLKEESFNIKSHNRNSLDYRYVIKRYYEPNGIKLVGYNHEEYTLPIEENIKKAVVYSSKKGMKQDHSKKSAHTNDNKHFIITSEKVCEGRFVGYKVFDYHKDNLRYLGFAFKGDDKRSPYFGYCEFKFNDEFYDEYWKWRRFRVNNQRIKFEEIEDLLKINKQIELDID